MEHTQVSEMQIANKIIKIVNDYKKHGVEKVFVSGIAFCARVAYVISLQQCLLTVYALCSESPFQQENGSNKQIGKLRAAAVKQSRKMFFLTRFWVILIFINPTLAKIFLKQTRRTKHVLNFVNGSGKFNPAAQLSSGHFSVIPLV